MAHNVTPRHHVETETAASYDRWLIIIASTILVLGLLMVASSSFAVSERQYGNPFHYISRQLVFALLGIMLGVVVLNIKLSFIEKYGPYFLVGGIALLIMVLIFGREINGSTRWLSLGGINIQPSELIKLLLVIYLAGYVVRHAAGAKVSFKAFVMPFIVVSMICFLMLLEPDFGSVVVVLVTTLGMLFLCGSRLAHLGLFAGLSGLSFVALIYSSPYRLQRLTGFMDPWSDPYASGFQLTQALIAIGRGELMGVGLGAGIQKLFYLPEAHTDFLFAIVAEEFGFIGSITVLALFTALVLRAFMIGKRAENKGDSFGAFLCYGIALWIGFQALTNIAVNMGVLPTKGLTLPLMSYGGSSLVVMCVSIALLLRVSYESNARPQHAQSSRPQQGHK